MVYGMNVSLNEVLIVVFPRIIDRLSILDAIKTFRNVIDNVPIEVEVLDRSENGSYFVNLFATHETFVCVNDFLLYHKIAIPVDDCRTLRVRFQLFIERKHTISDYYPARRVRSGDS